MFIFWNHSKDIKRKKNPIKLRRKCGNCSQVAFFYECEKTDEFKIYGLLSLKDEKTIVMQCGECLAVYKAEDDPDVQKNIDKREKEQRNKEAAEEAKAVKERQKEEARKQKDFDTKEKKKKLEIDDELEQMKRSLGP